MNLYQDFCVGDLHYQVRLVSQELEFALLNPPRRLLPHHRADAWLMFWDDDHYEDVDFNAPTWKVLGAVCGIVSAWLRRYQLGYFECHASTARKAEVYERLLQRRLPPEYAYQRVHQSFYVYRVNRA